MMGRRTFAVLGVVWIQIQQLEPRVQFTHCYGHALNSADCDTIKQSRMFRNAMNTGCQPMKYLRW